MLTTEKTADYVKRWVAAFESKDLDRVLAFYTDDVIFHSPLVARLSLLLTGNQLSAASVSTIRDAVTTIGADSEAGRNNRVWAAILLVMCSPDYIVQK